ncbi:P-loop containing nucleoside triphosphate hydrolase protein [Cutaneotrichosporon oleaginosum]|uniref:Origin recognition complex subunit 1 n=1 Tax=Cutaneotrichosporon oleaginosum TaxID=879819 RepID=A0A0J0XSJ9_9TREE|nr:P-loop containing nucleoside triphosphate hydrolase protein [Cutaneotrichosporon oleaginosum]KLT44030.1 P-loop containing nucleoside triphosphate hydrolase protein [Cutaneotrichosporon oleaginosum]TXT04024.1 hypothetical protein COLE_07721 [Cutaneotrichosporon oleaginosum]
MPVTPRRSTRQTAIFTPLSAVKQVPARYEWISGPSSTSPTGRTHYTSFERARGAGRKAEEARFAIGDGVSVGLEGGAEGLGLLIDLWEEPVPEDEREEADDETRKMARVHWFFRRSDLPSVMRNLTLEDNEVLLAASPTRPVTSDLPIALLVKTVPVYSRAVFKEQFPDEARTTKWKGYAWAKPEGVYWCARAYDKGAKGGRVWRVDVDAWKDRGVAGDWSVPLRDEESGEESDASEGEDEVSDGGTEDESASGSEQDEEEEEEDGEEEEKPVKKRGRPPKAATAGKKRKAKAVRGRPRKIPKVQKVKKAHPKASASHLPAAVEIDSLPTDPYERALRLLHVGATPESLPCREDEFVDVLTRLEEGVETGGGGCLYIAGVPGTGKTATVHAVVKELKRRAEDGEIAPFSYVEINGLKIPSPAHAYSILWEEISGQRGSSAKTALRGLEKHFARSSSVRGPRSNTYVVLMDELDQLLTAKQDVVYNFFNWPAMRDSQLFVIAIANRMDLPQHLATKIKSRLGLQTVLFQPYDRPALVEIVQSRLVPHPRSTADHKVLTLDAIVLAATKMAGTNGDARRVLDACRRAVEVSVKNGAGVVGPRDMALVLSAMSNSPVALFIKACGLEQKMMLAAMVRCVRREGVSEITWRALRADHDALTRALTDHTEMLSDPMLALLRAGLVASHALVVAPDLYKSGDERRLALGMEIGEVGRVLMNEGDEWRRALAGT